MNFAGHARTLSAAIVLTCSALPAAGQVVRGILLEDGSRRVVRFGSVALLNEEGSVAVTTGASIAGRFSLEAPGPGLYRFYAIALGYHATLGRLFELGAGDTLRIRFLIRPEAMQIDSLTVSVSPRSSRLDRTGFYDRLSADVGVFVTAADIAKSGALEVSDVFRRQPGVLVSSVTTSRLGFMQNRVLLRRGCIPALYVDDAFVREAAQPAPLIDEIVRPGEIAGIEIYRGPSEIPPRYGGALGSCGVIVIWTR